MLRVEHHDVNLLMLTLLSEDLQPGMNFAGGQWRIPSRRLLPDHERRRIAKVLFVYLATVPIPQ